MLRTAELDYELPESAIAVRPAEPRDAARLLVVSRSDPDRLEHRRVSDLPGLLRPRDLLVFNTTRVLRARLQGTRADTGGRVEGLYLEDAESGAARRWLVLLRGRRMKPGVAVALAHADGSVSGWSLRLIRAGKDEAGSWVVEVEGNPAAGSSAELLEAIGTTPLPPYILKARRHQQVEVDDGQDRARYQTVFAAEAGPGAGSVAAPTAGLHFTPELLRRLAEQGVARADVELQVGTGTFRTVETELVEDHPMHREWCSLGAATREAIRRARLERSGRVIAVGTTSARTIESFAAVADDAPETMSTRLLITPGYDWRWTDGLLTNFHLPRSTLLAMVASLLPGGAPRLLDLYRLALREGYRFYSYGDAMLVLP